MFKHLILLFLIFMLSLNITYGAGSGSSEQTEVQKVITEYYNALKSSDYGTAFNFMTDIGKKYYGTVDNYKSTFKTSSMKITDYKVYKIDIKNKTAMVKVIVSYTVKSFATGESLKDAKSQYDNLIKENGKWKIKLKFGPYKSIASGKSSEVNGLKIVVYVLDFYSDFIAVQVSFYNSGKDKLFILPYNSNSSLSDDKKNRYSAAEQPFVMDPVLFAGVTLAPGDKIMGCINFMGVVPRNVKKMTLKISSNLNPQKPPPFDVKIGNINIP